MTIASYVDLRSGSSSSVNSTGWEALAGLVKDVGWMCKKVPVLEAGKATL